ncbi:MAG: 4Fe-4S dicluster domain-containing protein [Spirochaetales bacterium]|nr:4Fe-4S dicluster domain-containing protein [Spirochaetales bacterium]
MSERPDAVAIRDAADAAGIGVFRLANVDRLIDRLDRTAWLPRPRRGSEYVLPALARAVPDPLSGSFLVCAHPYACDRPEDRGEPPAPGSFGLVSPFARRDYYRAAVKTLASVARRLSERTGAPRSAFRVFVNSRLPEKLIGCGAGLGRYGKNRLLFTDEYGSRFVIGLLFLPWRVDDEIDPVPPPSSAEWCGACAACLDACPVNALRGEAGLSACLKARSDALEPWDGEIRRAWGVRFYGCDDCQARCPKNAARVHIGIPAASAATAAATSAATAAATAGAVGAEIDLSSFLALTEEDIRARFRKTALGMSWILPRALLRNALCAAGNSGEAALLPAVSRYVDDPRPLLADTARWARGRISAAAHAPDESPPPRP